MAHRVSTKDVMQNTGFLAKLGSTLVGRHNPDPLLDSKTKASITWKKTSAVKHRIKTATGTIAIYESLTPEQLAEKQAEADREAGGTAPDAEGPADAPRVEEGEVQAALPSDSAADSGPPPPPPPPATTTTITIQKEQQVQKHQHTTTTTTEQEEHNWWQQEDTGLEEQIDGTTTTTSTSATTTTLTFRAEGDYTPEDDEGLQVVDGQILTLIDKSSPFKRPRLEADDGVATQLLDNSAAKHKMAIRPRRNHPDPRSRGQDPGEERWVMRDEESGKEGLVPSRVLTQHSQTTTTSLRSSLKRTVQQIALEEPLEVKQGLVKEIREYKSRKLSSKPLLGPSPEDEARAKRTATIRELVETEDEFVKDLQFVMENYYDLLENNSTPRAIRDQKDLIFNNFKFINEFHQNVLIEGVKYHAEVPTMIGKTFLRLERDFDRHAEYCTNEPLAQEFLDNSITVKEFFEDHSQGIGDEKRLQEHLKLPIQRLNDYQLLLKELVKYSGKLGDDTTDLQKAYELMQTIPQRATDAKFINSIEGFKGNLYKLGRLVRHDWFSVKEEGLKARDRYLFLFKARILITKVKRISEDRSIFVLRDIIRLPETSLGSLDNPKALEFSHIEPASHPNYPVHIEARTPEIRDSWLAGVEEYVVDTASVEDLLFDDELRVISEELDEDDLRVSSPLPEVQTFEELPNDKCVESKKQSVKEAKKEEKKEEKKEKEAVKEVEAEDDDFWAQFESSEPTPKTKENKGIQNNTKDILEQVDEEVTNEQRQITLTTTSQEPTLPTTTTTTTTTTTPPSPPPSSPPTADKASGRPKVVLPKPEEAQRKSTPRKTSKGTAKMKEEEPSTPATPGGTPKPVFTKTLKGDVVEPGDDVGFVCEVAHPLPYFVTWLKDNKPLDDKLADRIQQQDAGSQHSLKVLNCHVDDSGIYTAKATDEANISATCSAQLLVHEFTEEERARRIAEKSPFFLVKMKPTEVIENTNLSYTIHVKGDPMPENVQFLKDDQQIVEDERVKIHRDPTVGHYEMLISHVQREDEGVYKCVARNKFGKAECEAEMTVSDEQLVYESLSGKGSLLATGEKAEFKWFRDGQEFDPLERFNVMFKDDEDTLALVFQNVTPEDAGLYTCVASTSCGKISCSAELTVEGSINRLFRDPEPPSIKEEMTNTQVSVGGSAMLECKVGGYPKPELKWSKNGLDLETGGRLKVLWEDEESVALVIKNVEERDAGLYQVDAVNELGQAYSTAKLAIRAGPKIKKLRKEIPCIVGDNLDYSIEVEGEPEPVIHIMVDGRPVESTDRVKLEQVKDNLWKFTIKGMVAGDCGSYTVVAVNDVAQVSDFFTIATDSAPQITREMDSETEKKLHMDVTIEVRATGSPRPDARWFKDGKEIMADERFKMTRDDTFYLLKIRRVERTDKGVYKCLLKNTVGEASTQGDLHVRAPPLFVTPLKDTCAKEGTKEVKLFAEWEANPPPTVKWYFKDKPVREDTEGFAIRGAQDTSQILVILQATPEFVGPYTVKAANEYGESTCKGRFRLHEPPAITQSLKDTEFLEFEASKFTFKAFGIPQPDVKWTKDGKKWTPDERRVRMKVEGEDTFTLIFEEALTADSGHYVATVSNVEGTVTTEADLTVNTPPHIKGANFNEGKTLIAHHKFLLQVEATAVPKAEATWYLNDKELPDGEDGVKLSFDGTKYSLERVGSDPEHSGEYKCVLKNKIAAGEEKGNITVKEKESRVRNKLQDMFVKENTDAVVKCQIVGDPIPEVQWLRDGKPLPLSEKFEVSSERMSGWHTLLVKDVKEGDKCSFTLKGKNQHGECETTCRLGVLVKPAPGPLHDALVDFGKDLHVTVTIHAFPKPTMAWTLNGQELKDGGRTVYTRDEDKEEYGLLLHEAALEDDGKLSFTASNEAGSETRSCYVKVHYEKPTVIGALHDTGFCLEQDGTFTFRASGLPLPECHWTKNGIPLKDDNKHEITNPEPGVYCLTIKDVDKYDFGEVSVAAKSLVGETTSSAQLTQQTMECSLVEGLDNVTHGPEGDDVTLSVRVKGSPRPTFVWSKDGDDVEASAKFKVGSKKTSYCEATISLTILEASAIDSGQYRLKCMNEVNEIDTETAFIVRPERRKPKVTKKPQELKVMEREPGIFQVKIIGFPKPEVKWLKDGRQVYPSDEIDIGVTAEGLYYLEFRGVTEEDMGRYTVTATNELGACEADTQLSVVPPPSKPEFLQSLRSSKVIIGYPVRMEVKLGGSPLPEVQWLRDGQPIALDGTHYRQVTGPNGSVCLQIDAATEGDTGEITCVAKNPEGDTSSSAKLSVLDVIREDGQPDSPAKFSEGLKDLCADEGETLRLPVTMKGGPVPGMKWYKDGKEVKLGDRVFFTYDGDRAFLEIRPAKGTDSGMYKCVIENEQGKAETECEVSIRKCFEPPSFTSTFCNQYKLPGSDVRMGVKYDGLPLPELTWYHDKVKLESDGDKIRIRKDGEGQTLMVKDSTYSDSGVYRVVAKNKEGTVEYKAELFVSDDVDPKRRPEAPVFLKVCGDQEVFEGSKALFKAIVMGRPEPEFRWYKDGSAIISTNRTHVERDSDGLIRLSVRYVSPEDAGTYQLKAWNDHGEASCTGKLICETLTSRTKRPVGDEYQGFDKIRRSGVPMPLPDRPMISGLSDRRATISWMPHLAAPPTQPCTYLLEMAEYPEGDWTTVRTGVRGCSADVSTLLPKSDYRFRVRAANKHGVSEPSPYVQTYRHKLELPPISYEPWMDPNYDYKGEGPYVPEGFRISRDVRGNYYAAPRFLRLDHDTQYGMTGFNASIKWYAYGYPLPKVSFFRNDAPLDVGRKGSRYTYSHEATGAICLYIDRLTSSDLGGYECLVTNEYGRSRQRIKLDLSEYPRVLQPLEELHLRANNSGKIMCRISGYPACEVKWYRDWEPLQPSFKFRPSFLEPDWYVLNINGVSVKDAGLYSVAAVNVAGSVHSSCMLHVEDDNIGFYWSGPSLGRQVTFNSRRGALEDHYDIGDELGRGTQGVSYHCVEHHTGRNFTAKSMWGKDNFKTWMQNEFDMMNQISTCKHLVRLYDAFETVNNMVLVTELCGGGDLLSTLTTRTYITEYEVCWYVRQLLLGVDHMHDHCLAHLGINLGDIMLVRPNGMEIKLGDLSLARHIRINNVYPLDYGMPEFVAPEVVNGEGVTYAVDMWAIGVVTYILLTGISPFRGENDRETLTKVKKGEVNFDREAFSHISDEAKDFIAKLLDYKADTRMEAKTALRHPWLTLASSMPRDPYRINTDRLRTYSSRFREWYSNASCRRWYRRRTLASCFSHPSKMVYPPGEVYTPLESPEREIIPSKAPEDYHIPERDYSYQLEAFKNDSNYQQGPDTYLLQLKDVEFPCRLRSYMKVAEVRSPSFAMGLRDKDYDYEKIPIVHERRRFTDVMDEEIDDDRRKRRMIDRKTISFIRGRMETCALDMPRPSKYETTTHLALTERVREVEEGSTPNTAPFLREKPQTTAITIGGKLDLTVVASGVPEPGVQWFRNDAPLSTDAQRLTITTTASRSTLTIDPSKDLDAGLYKVVARNDAGQVTHKFRLLQGHVPGPCDTPEVPQIGESEMFVKWKSPIEDGGARVLCYRLEMKQSGDIKWTSVAENIDHEFFRLSNLTHDTTYFFRVSAKNSMGWGDCSPATAPTKTHATGVTGSHKVEVPQHMLQLQKQTESGKTLPQCPERRDIDYSKELEPVKLKTGENAELQVRKYSPVVEVSRGRFGNVAKCVRTDDHRHFVLKVLQTKGRESQVTHEYEMHSSLRHERIVQLYEAYSVGAFTVLVLEPLSGLDILTYLASLYQYSEQQVYTVTSQVLDALSYLHWRGYCHLDLQPDNIVVTSSRKCDVKLVDFGSAQKVAKLGSDITPSGHLDYTAPEVLLEHKAHLTSDVWSLGALVFALLAGRSAFGGVDEEDTKANIQYVKFKGDHLNPGVSQEAIRFLMLIFKRDPCKRPTVEECWDHKWLVESDYTAKKRERIVFYGATLREYDRAYHEARIQAAIKSSNLLNFNDAAFPPTITYDIDNLSGI